jgi:serine/threonine protein kinase
MKILFLVTNPVDVGVGLQVDEEFRQISQKIRMGTLRDQVEFVSEWAVMVSDLQAALLRQQPDIVHFRGHWRQTNGIVLEDKDGNSETVSQEALANLFSIMKANVRVVVLNGGYPKKLAQALVKTIDFTIWMDAIIGDSAAINFIASFYQSLAFGFSVEEAFKLARNQLEIDGVVGAQIPELLVRNGVNASEAQLVGLSQMVGHLTEPTRILENDSNKLAPQKPPSLARTTGKKGDPYRLVGETIGHKYHLEEYAGGGGMGAVYRCYDKDLAQVFALKILKPDIVVNNPLYAELFKREVEAARQLNHPHIVKLVDSGVDDNISFMVMEWLEGRTLDDVLQGERLEINRVVDIFNQICMAVARAHEKNIIHLDIKPANIFMVDHERSRDFIKVIDFGLARVLKSDSGTTVTRFRGTNQYCSPEHFGGKLTHRSDIYSLGVMLYQLLTGVLPFRASHINAKMHPNLEMPPITSVLRLRPDLPKTVETVIFRAISRNPNDRQQSVRQLYQEFSDSLNLSAALLTQDINSLRVKAKSFIRKYKRVFWVAGVIIALLIGGFLLYKSWKRQPTLVATHKPPVLAKLADKLIWFDENGNAIDEFPGSQSGTTQEIPPIATGFSENVSSKYSISDNRERVAVYNEIKEEFINEPTIWGFIDEVELASIKYVNLRLARPSVLIQVGNTDFRARFERAFQILQASKNSDKEFLIKLLKPDQVDRILKKANDIEFIDATRPDRIVLNFKKP